ncbi:MAG: hypothetical protein ACO3JL_21320, partial [Myxococcota bacterium]
DLPARRAALLAGPGTTAGPEDPPAPAEGQAILIIQGSDDEVEADGQSALDITIRTFDKDQVPDNRPISVFIEGAFASSDVHTIENDGADLLGTPVAGELSFQVSCALLDTGTAKVSATNGEATNTFEFDCTEPEGEVVLEVQLDEEFPCDAVLADGQSFCRVPIYVELQSPTINVPQGGYRLTAQVTSATLTNPDVGQDATVTDLALLAPDDDSNQSPQEQISVQTGEDGIARFRVATRLNEPMRIGIQVTGAATVGDAPERTVSVEVDPFESKATIELTASPQSIGSDLTTQLVVTAIDYQGRPPGVDAEVTLSVPPDSGAILRAAGAESVDGQLTVNIAGGTALVEFDAPAVTAQTEYTVSVGYRPHPSLPVISDTAVVRVFPDNSLLLNLEVEPAEIASDEN